MKAGQFYVSFKGEYVMDFIGFKTALQRHVFSMLEGTDHLFVVDVDKDAIWSRYLDSFPVDANKIFRKRAEHDCSACRHFIRSFGNVVKIENARIVTIWDFRVDDPAYQMVVDALAAFIRSKPVTNVLVTREAAFGVDKNHESATSEDGSTSVLTWEHLYVRLPDRFVMNICGASTEDSVRSSMRDLRNVFKRSLDEITEDAIQTVLELIADNSLYKGEESKSLLQEFLKIKKLYEKLPHDIVDRDNWAWEQSVKVGAAIGKIRNHAIGTLLTDVSQGVSLDEAVSKFEAMVAPQNYKRPKAIFTKKMLDDAQHKIEELGLSDSLGRRMAVLDDITINNVLFANRDAAKRIAGSVFDDMAASVAIKPKSFDRAEEISIDDFIKNVLPTATSIDAYLENRHVPNLVSLIAPQVKDSKTLFKWGNGFSWAYAGNITDAMKERVKALGGDVTGDLRFSIMWNENGDNDNDFDAHCIEPDGNEIYFRTKKGRVVHASTGELDVDIIDPRSEVNNKTAVENITYRTRSKMPEGVYRFFVHNYNHRGGRTGFAAEIEFDGQIFSFSYPNELRQDEKVVVAEVSYSRKDGFKLIEHISSSVSSRKAWGLDTNQLHPVSIIMYSPNYWDAQEGIGNRHYFFMLKNCVNDEQPNGFFNEYLREDLSVHKHVFEALGAKMRVEAVDDQLSGLGFSSTKKSSLVVKVEGKTSRMLKINF
jgi:hypothetical protein